MSWEGIKSFFGVNSPSAKAAQNMLPRCFGVYRSPQSDAEKCCGDCVRNKICYEIFMEKQERTEPKISDSTSNSSRSIPKQRTRLASQQAPEKSFMQIFGQLSRQQRAWEIWKDFITMFACVLSNPVDKIHYDKREALYMKIIKKYSKRERQLFPELAAETIMALEINPEQDFLGKIFMTLQLDNEANGQVFTPYNLCQLIAAIATENVISRVEKDGYITIHDPCCGAGATLIAGIHEARKQLEKANLNFQNHILITGQDIDPIVALMCYIQLSLLGMAGYIKVGNSLTEPMAISDSVENYWFTPMYFSDVWETRRLIKKMSSLFEK